MKVRASEYMHWAKTRQAATCNLANSGVHPVRWAELGIQVEDLELSGPSYYGWPPLLDALSVHLGVTSDRICHAEGTSMANHLAMAACVDPGDMVLIEDPTYSLLVDTAQYLGTEIARFPRRREDQYQPDVDAIRRLATDRTKLIVLTDLHNPSSARLSSRTLEEVARLAGEVGAQVLVDEVYLDAAFDPHATTAHRLSERIMTTSSLTKVYGLNGLRCGWVVAAPSLIESMRRLTDLFGVVPAHAAECLSLVALRQLPDLRERSRQILEANRDAWNDFVAGRDDLEVGQLTGGTVVFPRLRRGSVTDLCGILREKYETTVVPGSFFGASDCFRVGLGLPNSHFAEGLHRLGHALNSVRN